MKHRLFAVIMSLMLVVTFMPTTTFASSSVWPSGKNISGVGVTNNMTEKIQVKNVSLRSKVAHNDDELEIIKQTMYEEHSMLMNEVVGQEDLYCSDVWDAMMQLSDIFMTKVETADSVDDIVMELGGWLFVDEDFMKELYAIEYLESLTKQQATSTSDLPRLKNDLKKELEKAFKYYDRSEFDDYYWGILTSRKAELNSSINSIGTYMDYALVMYDLDYNGWFEDNNEDEEWMTLKRASDVLAYDEEYEDEEYYISSWINTKDEVKKHRKRLKTWANDVLNKEMKEIGYTSAPKEFSSALKSLEKRIDSEVDCVVMYQDYERFVNSVYEKAESLNEGREEISSGDLLRFQKKLTAAFMNYKESDYSQKQWKKLNKIYDKYIARTDGFWYEDQLKDSVVKEMTTEMNKVKTLKQEAKELKQLKEKRIKQINKYAKSKKFNHKKSIPLAKKAVKKIKAAKTKEKVNSIYKQYKAKIKKTAKKKK